MTSVEKKEISTNETSTPPPLNNPQGIEGSDLESSVPEVSITKTVRLKAPRTVEKGEVIKSSIDGIVFWARVPEGGVKQFELFETDYPRFVKVTAPKDLDGGEQFLTKYTDGISFLAIVPMGGCREGDVFETLHPSMAPPENGLSPHSRRRWPSEMCCPVLCGIFLPLIAVLSIALIAAVAAIFS